MSLLHRTHFTFALRPWLLVALIGWLAMPLSAQRADKWVKKGEAALSERSYLQALDYFAWSLRKDTTYAALSGMARAHQALSDFPKAATFWRLAALRPDAAPTVHYELGRALMSINKTEAAIASFQRYYAAAPSDPLAQRYAQVATWLPEMFKDTALYTVERLRINSKYADFGATWYQDGILFCSNRPREVGVVYSNASDGMPLTDLYYSAWDSVKGWRPAKAFEAANSRYHDGPACADLARGLFYLTRSTRPEKAKGAAPLSILTLQPGEGKLNPYDPAYLPLPAGAAFAHPALSTDGQRLYFSSDMPGGMGGTDIWYLQASGSTWSAPIHAGPQVNTPGNESYPALQADGTLFFTSDGHPGLGGLDIFLVRPDGDGWRSPLNPGSPINSQKDDFAFLPKADGADGLFSSNRSGGNDDLYAYRRTAPAFECQPQKENVYCFRFWDDGGLDTDDLPLYYAWSMGDGTTYRGLDIYHCFPGPGDYIVELNLIDSISGFLFSRENRFEHSVRDSAQPYINAPLKVAAGAPVRMDALKSTLTDCEPGKYFWEYGDGQRGIGTEVTHTYTDAGTYTIRLGITGDEPGSSSPCKACVTRSIEVLPAGSAIPQATPHSFRPGTPPSKEDRPQNEAKPLFNLADSTGLGFRVKIAEEEAPLSRKEPPLSLLQDQQSIVERKVGDSYQYTYGDADSRNGIYEKYSEAQEKGIEEAIVVAFKGDREIGADSTSLLKVPGKRSGDTYTIFSGEIRDSKGRPLSVTLSLEDLLHHTEVVTFQSDSAGRFRLRLPNGQLYGYYLESPGYFPYSDQLDLRDRRVDAKTELSVSRDITMSTVQEVVDMATNIPINNVFFDYDQSILRSSSYAELDRIVKMMVENPGIKLEIYGHTDSDGDALYNLELSKRRADAVASYLVSHHPKARIMNTFGYGEMRPIAAGNSAEAKQRNRRVEIRLFRD